MRTRIAPVLLTALALGCAAPPLADQQPVAVSPISGSISTKQVALATDASGTMYARQTFPEAKALTRSFVASMPDQPHNAGLVAFGGEARTEVPVGPFDRATLASTAASLTILGDLDGRGGHTPTHRIFQALEPQLPGSGGNAAVVLFSDGLPDRPAWALMAATNLAAAHGGQLCFHAVQTGSDPLGAEFMTALAGITSCSTARSADSLRDAASLMAFTSVVYGARSEARPTPLPIDSCGDLVRLRGIEFDFDKYDVRSDSAVVLDVAVDQLGSCPDLAVRVDGHTDWVGTEVYNQGLSERRAAAVRDYLLSKGIDRGRLSTKGFGEQQPIASNETRGGRAQNRRVELHPR